MSPDLTTYGAATATLLLTKTRVKANIVLFKRNLVIITPPL